MLYGTPTSHLLPTWHTHSRKMCFTQPGQCNTQSLCQQTGKSVETFAEVTVRSFRKVGILFYGPRPLHRKPSCCASVKPEQVKIVALRKTESYWR